MSFPPSVRAAILRMVVAISFFVLAPRSPGEVMLQFFNSNWKDITTKIPELAEAGYDSLWLPPPTKAGSVFSVGYDEFDAFDLGDNQSGQSGSVGTFYGTTADLLNLVTVAHRFGMRVYLDNISNHRGFSVPGYDANTSISLYPGLVPEDFHLLTTPDGFYRNTYDIADWNNSWDVIYESLEGLCDLANEPGTTNLNFGASVGSNFPKISFVRHPARPDFYCYNPAGQYVGFGANNGLTTSILAANPSNYSEYVQDFENRAVRWEIDTTKCDGIRLDAVKSVRDDFYGAEYGSDMNTNSYGYCGQIQLQYNLTHNFNPGNLRASNFNSEIPRTNALIFGEHLGSPPAQDPYINAGMRLVDNNLSSSMSGNFSYGPMTGFDQPGGNGLPEGQNCTIAYVQSADYGYATKQQLQYAFILARAGLPVVYTDGFNYAPILGSNGKAFPANSYNNYLGEYGDTKLPSMLYVHNQFARGDQIPKWADTSVAAFERQDKRENSSMTDADGTVMLFMMNGNGAAGQNRNITTTFPAGSYLWQYATGTTDAGDNMTGFYYTVPSNQQVGDITIPKDGYFAFSWRSPENSNLWKNGGGKEITILQSGSACPTMTYSRKDGTNGDPNFNPYGVAGAVAGSYSYPYTVPRITDGSSLSFLSRADGSAENMLMELDGGVNINSQMNLGPTTGELRDHPPTLATDVFLGYEQMQFVDRQYPEKFAAVDSTRDNLGSAGSETYQTTVGSGTFTENNGPVGANSSFDTQGGTVPSFVFHDPTQTVDNDPDSTIPKQYNDSGAGIVFWAKTNSVGAGFKMFVYYTTDSTFPEGAGGSGIGTTKVAQMTYHHNAGDGNNWWTGSIAAKPSGPLRYKIGMFDDGNGVGAIASVFPSNAAAVAKKVSMMTTFQVTNFNAITALVYPHNDYASSQTGLTQGFHVLRTREFLNRAGRASIYNTGVQTFYYDTQLPGGQVVFPAENDTLGQGQYGAVVRTDLSVTEVDYKIIDSDSTNDDSATTVANGNNAWVAATQLTATPSISSTFPSEWRFNYVNIPSSGNAQILVRLKKLSSSADNSLSDAAGHYTTLTRDVTTTAPAVKMSVEFPTTDGQTVDSSYVMKVLFSNSLASGLSNSDLLNKFLITISSSESGSVANPVTQPRSAYSISAFNVGPNNAFDELAYKLPNLYNGIPNFLHTITVTCSGSGAPTLTATRLVKAAPVVSILDSILNPPEVDARGTAYETVLADTANPTAAQRTVPIVVQTDTNAQSVAISFTSGPAVSGSNIVLTSTTASSNTLIWNFAWTNVQPGTYRFASTVTETGSATASATRDVDVVYRTLVANTGKNDNDDDGIPDTMEQTQVALPAGSSDLWTNDQVHRWAITGKTNPLSPDTDADGLVDGLELGLTSPMALSGSASDTNTATSTNGASTNFQIDLDPPIYNTNDNSGSPSGQDYSYYKPWAYNSNKSHTDQIAGTMTDPTKDDTDDDGVNDGLEDLTYAVVTGSNGSPVLDGNNHVTFRPVHNGRVDIIPDVSGTQTVIAHPPTNYNTSVINRTAVLATSPNAMWLETDPNNQDTTGNGLSDGSKDGNHNGIVDLSIVDRNQTDGNGNYVVLATLSSPVGSATVQGSAGGSQPVTFYYADFCYRYIEPTDGKTYYSTALDKVRLNSFFRPGGSIRSDGLDIVWKETDPRRFSTSGDGLPDGWKLQYGLNPFDDGVIGHYNLSTGKVITNTNNGPSGNPTGDGISNLQKYINGDDPRVSGSAAPVAPGTINIGPVAANKVTVGGITNNEEFSGWTAQDLISLDYYDGGGVNYSGGDVYHAGDGFDTSRDMVAFYAHDGGDINHGGDGKFYFRVDFEDLLAYAEQGYLDVYVAINFGKPGTGEYNLPDNLRTGTKMGWQAVVACYQSNSGNIYLSSTTSTVHSTGIGQDLSTYGVTVRNQASTNGFGNAYYNSDLDACDFSISRQALIDAGWDGLDASKLTYEVFTTKDGTQSGGAGDLGTRSNIRDTFYDDWIASDYYNDQANITGNNSVLQQWAGLNARNENGKKVKVITLLHGNEAIQPGSYTQNLINTGSGAGFYRPLDVHQAYNVPLTMHITPTLASAIQWASVSGTSAHAYKDGPALNARIATMIANGQIDLVGSTFSDHILNYFGSTFNADNVALANQYLQGIYGHAPSSKVLWLPERTTNDSVLAQIASLGFGYTFVDQTQHIFDWFGRSSSLGSGAYRINSINGMKAFVINDNLGQYMFQSQDNGPSTLLRQTLNAKARDGQQDQVLIFENSWESFATKANADAYDANIRWMATRPWIQIVTPDQIVNGQVDTSVPPNGSGTTWGTVDRGTGNSLPTVSTNWINHATNGSYDNWYNGSALYESLKTKQFNIRSGVPVPGAYGINTGTGLVASTWSTVAGLTGSNSALSPLARATLHASVYETAFHNESNNDLDQFSTGSYVNPNTTFQSLATLSTWAQSQTRAAAMYAKVSSWASLAAAGTYSSQAVAEAADIDQDGEPEYLLYNDRVFALFERIGGRMTNAWVRDIVTGEVFQALGNPVGYAGSETEEEGAVNLDATSGTPAYRTSGFKDLFAQTGAPGVGNNNYVNDYFAATPAASGTGWQFVSSDSKVTKVVTLGAGASIFNAKYTLSSINQLYVRFGLSPNLTDLLINGQKNLSTVVTGSAGEYSVVSGTPQRSVRSFVKYGGAGYTGALTAAATDSNNGFDTVNLRNQAQTHQVELSGSSQMTIGVGFQTNWTDTLASDADGLPDWWRLKYFGHVLGQAGDLSRAGDDMAKDGLTNLQKYILGFDPTTAQPGGVRVTVTYNASHQPVLNFPTNQARFYRVLYSATVGGSFLQAGSALPGTGGVLHWTDDGSQTGGAPSGASKRFYQVQVSLQ